MAHARIVACPRCRQQMELFDDAPACGHPVPCWIGFCFPCTYIRYMGPCATELAAELRSSRPTRYDNVPPA